MVRRFDRLVYGAVVGFQIRAYQDVVYSEIELVLVVRNPQSFAGLGERVVQSLGEDAVRVRDRPVVEVAACYNGRVAAFRNIPRHGIRL